MSSKNGDKVILLDNSHLYQILYFDRRWMSITIIKPIIVTLFLIVILSTTGVQAYGPNIINTQDKSQIITTTNNYKNILDSNIKIGPPTRGVYESALTDFGGTEDEVSAQKIIGYEKMIGKNITWAYFSNNWKSGIRFPEETVKTIHSLGIVPFIRMMPRTTTTDGIKDPIYTLQGFIDGKFDNDLRRWADDAKRIDIPIMVEFGTEVNGDWFPWSGILNGAGKTDGYGDPNYPDGPERFRDAYIHIIDLFRKEDVRNITWCFHVFARSDTGVLKAWNSIENYYPGDNYIDWIGVSIYGTSELGAEWDSFVDLLDDTYPALAATSTKKPLAVFEFGIPEDPSKGNKSEWLKDALQSIESGRYPRIKAISYWDEKWFDCNVLCVPGVNSLVDLRLNSDAKSIEVYRKMIASPFFVSEPNYVYDK
jgi:beta-mannanase